jgi:hypothetical protein
MERAVSGIARACIRAAIVGSAAAFALAGAAWAAPAAPATAIAFVTEASGAASAGEPPRALAFLSAIGEGETLVLARGALLTLAFPGEAGFVAQVRGPGRFAAARGALRALAGTDPAAVAVRDLAAPLRALRIDAAGAARAGVSMRGEAAASAALPQPAPTAGAVFPESGQLPEDVRELSWPEPPATPGELRAEGAPPAAVRYEVRLVDDSGRVAFAQATAGRRVALPEGLAFAPGGNWVWIVEAFRRDRHDRVLEVEFRIPPQEDLERARAALAFAGGAPERSERIVLALGLAGMGLADRARTVAPAQERQAAFTSRARGARWHRADER